MYCRQHINPDVLITQSFKQIFFCLSMYWISDGATVSVEFAFENMPRSEGKSGVVAQGDTGMYVT